MYPGSVNSRPVPLICSNSFSALEKVYLKELVIFYLLFRSIDWYLGDGREEILNDIELPGIRNGEGSMVGRGGKIHVYMYLCRGSGVATPGCMPSI